MPTNSILPGLDHDKAKLFQEMMEMIVRNTAQDCVDAIEGAVDQHPLDGPARGAFYVAAYIIRKKYGLAAAATPNPPTPTPKQSPAKCPACAGERVHSEPEWNEFHPVSSRDFSRYDGDRK